MRKWNNFCHMHLCWWSFFGGGVFWQCSASHWIFYNIWGRFPKIASFMVNSVKLASFEEDYEHCSSTCYLFSEKQKKGGTARTMEILLWLWNLSPSSGKNFAPPPLKPASAPLIYCVDRQSVVLNTGHRAADQSEHWEWRAWVHLSRVCDKEEFASLLTVRVIWLTLLTSGARSCVTQHKKSDGLLAIVCALRHAGILFTPSAHAHAGSLSHTHNRANVR